MGGAHDGKLSRQTLFAMVSISCQTCGGVANIGKLSGKTLFAMVSKSCLYSGGATSQGKLRGQTLSVMMSMRRRPPSHFSTAPEHVRSLLQFPDVTSYVMIMCSDKGYDEGMVRMHFV